MALIPHKVKDEFKPHEVKDEFKPHEVKENWFYNYFDINEVDLIKSKDYEISKFDSKIYQKDIFKFDFRDINIRIFKKNYNIGNFQCLLLNELKNIIGKPSLQWLDELHKLSNLEINDSFSYESMHIDISKLILKNQEENAVFQAVSQFNLLEMFNDNAAPERGN